MEITSDFVTYLMIVAIIYLLGNVLLSIIQFHLYGISICQMCLQDYCIGLDILYSI